MQKPTLPVEAIVVCVAIALRVAAWFSIEGTGFETPVVDAFVYFEQASQLLEGEDPFAGGYYQPPGYPWLLSLELRLFGPEASTGRAVNLVLGTLTTWLVARIGVRLGGPGVGLVAGLVYTLYGTTLLFELDLLTPATTNFLLAVALYELLGERTPARAAIAGGAMGVAVVVHPTLLLAAIALGAFLRGRNLAAYALAAAVALGPTTARNIQAGHPALVSHNAGLNFYLGNNPDWKETALLRPGIAFRRLVVQANPGERDQYERNAYWKERALDEISQDPPAFLSALATKALWSVSDREVPRNEDFRCRTDGGSMRWLAFLPARFGVVFPFAVLGLFVAWRKRKELPWMWLALHLPMVIFLVADRYRMATWPVVALSAALGSRRLVELLRERSRWALVVLAVGWLPWIPIDYATARQEGWCLHGDANRAFAADDFAGAADLYLAATRREPDELGHWYWLGETYVRLERTEEAIDAFERVVRDYPDHYGTRMALQREYGRLGRYSEAADHAQVACGVPGPRDNTCARWIQLLYKAGRVYEAESALADRPELREHERLVDLPW